MAMKNSIRNSLLISSLIALSGLNVCLGNFDAGIINLDYKFTAIGLTTYGPGAAVVGLPGDFWNSGDVGLGSVGLSNLKTTSGLATSVGWSIASGGGFGIPSTTGTYAKLMDAGVLIYSAAISNLTPHRNYDLYLFSGSWTQLIRVNGTDFSTPALAHFGEISTLTAGGNYQLHTVTADASGQLSFEGIYSQFDSTPSITSWQLVAVPEPGGLALLGLGCLFALCRWRETSVDC